MDATTWDRVPVGPSATRRFDEASEQERSLPGFMRHSIQLSPGRFDGSISSLVLSGFSILRERINVAVAHIFMAPEASIVAVCQPSHPVGCWVDAGSRTGGTFGIGRGCSRIGIRAENSDVIMVVADRAAFSSANWRTAGDVQTRPSPVAADALFDWLASLLAVYANGEAERSPGHDALLADLLRDRLETLSASTSTAPADRAVFNRQAHALSGVMHEWLLSHPREPTTVTGLSRAIGASPAELRRASIAVLGTPLDALLLARRLGQARRDIIAARQDRRRISDIALDGGFLHWGRFSGAYRGLFGETPSQTLRGV
ncbi:helix-turn-helix domain-containing protein [Aureimonas sp. Leaf454]|uniref:helix-turn-helix domain-containing protein n=1 Tax=Aureimonas sp. Leaf454 TaxID=1736381 RepID=UPI00138F40EB|nr:helix-turn-helix domain-containing protein [Aureimonas sp. Leaf454]